MTSFDDIQPGECPIAVDGSSLKAGPWHAMPAVPISEETGVDADGIAQAHFQPLQAYLEAHVGFDASLMGLD